MENLSIYYTIAKTFKLTKKNATMAAKITTGSKVKKFKYKFVQSVPSIKSSGTRQNKENAKLERERKYFKKFHMEKLESRAHSGEAKNNFSTVFVIKIHKALTNTHFFYE